MLPQDLLRAVRFAAHIARVRLSYVAENRVGLVPSHVRRQGLPIGEDVRAELALEFVVGEILLRFVAGAMDVPQVVPQLRDVVEFVIAYLTLEIPLRRRRR